MLFVLSIVFLIALLRLFIPGPWQGQAPLLAIIVIGIVLVYELGMLRQVRCGLRHGKSMPVIQSSLRMSKSPEMLSLSATSSKSVLFAMS